MDKRKTEHQILFSNAQDMGSVSFESVDLVVTSPPYPMIRMWDSLFIDLDPDIGKALARNDGPGAFEMMNLQLDPVWKEIHRVLKPGGFACINIGDATRTLDGHFMLYPSHARILSCLVAMGFTPLPEILWRKQTNAPNKFMGSGMLPAGAYVTLEHEYILIVRKGGKRGFTKPESKKIRHESSFFWEERNLWFSDIWFDLKGARQVIKDESARKRSAAYPFELPYRLINMYSVKGDLVLDPFTGIGTTTLAAMAAQRNSIGFELEPAFSDSIASRTDDLITFSAGLIDGRLNRHREFIIARSGEKKTIKHHNDFYNFPVITSQEKKLILSRPVSVDRMADNRFEVGYSDAGPDMSLDLAGASDGLETVSPKKGRTKKESGSRQLRLFE